MWQWAARAVQHKCGSTFLQLCPHEIFRKFINQAVDERFELYSTLSDGAHSYPSQTSKKVVPFDSVKIDSQDLSSVTFSHLLTMDPPFQILGLDFGDVHHQSVVQYRAMVSHNNELNTLC